MRRRQGKGEIGQKIIDTAREHDVPIEESASLAGALSEVEIGDEIARTGWSFSHSLRGTRATG